MDLAIYKHEVEALIGEGVCSVKTLTRNNLYCEPPVEQPLIAANNKHKGMDNLPEFKVNSSIYSFHDPSYLLTFNMLKCRPDLLRSQITSSKLDVLLVDMLQVIYSSLQP